MLERRQNPTHVAPAVSLAPAPSRFSSRQRRTLAAAGFLLAVAGSVSALDGLPDPTGGSSSILFNLGGVGYDFASACAAEKDGGVVLAGRATEEDGSGHKIAVARLAANGVLDPLFGTGGRLSFSPGTPAFYSDPLVLAMAREPSGAGYILAGTIKELGSPISFFLRVTAGGVYDTTFGLYIVLTQRAITAVAIDPVAGTIWLAGQETDGSDGVWAVEKRAGDGTALGATSFTIPGVPTGGPTAIALQPDGKVVLVGVGRPTAGIYNSAGIARLLPTVVLDSLFGFNGGRYLLDYGVNTVARSVAVRPDGRILFAGEIGDPIGYNYLFVTQLRADGTLSTDWGFGNGNTTFVSFDQGGASGDGASGGNRMALTTDGKVLVAAQATTGQAGNVAEIGIARYTPSGELDPTFGQANDGRAVWDLPPVGNGAGNDWPTCVTTTSGKPLIAGAGEWSGSDWDFGTLRLGNNHIFSDSFESGTTVAWGLPS